MALFRARWIGFYASVRCGARPYVCRAQGLQLPPPTLALAEALGIRVALPTAANALHPRSDSAYWPRQCPVPARHTAIEQPAQRSDCRGLTWYSFRGEERDDSSHLGGAADGLRAVAK
jgi:hypothetical protein